MRGATAHNVVGVLPGRTDGSPIVIGGHHDCWFAAAFDDATGVAATLAIAKALVDAGYEPEHPIVFTSHTAEEYGRADSAFDWLIGAWWQIAHEHPEWAEEALLYVNIEGTGMACPMGIDAPPELRRFARGVVARARRDGLLQHGVAWGVPRTGTEQWPFAAAGVPSLGVADEVWDYMRTKYHTQYDDLSLVDPRVCRRGRQVLRAARDRRRPQPGRAARSRRPFTSSAAPRRAACARGLRRRHPSPCGRAGSLRGRCSGPA